MAAVQVRSADGGTVFPFALALVLLYASALGSRGRVRLCVCVSVSLLKATNCNWSEMLGTPQTGFALCPPVLRVNAVHPCRRWGALPGRMRFESVNRKYMLVSFSNLNNRLIKA